MSFEQELDEVLSELREMVLEKNRRYGDSALNPLRIFSKASPMEQIFVRMDDKLSRLARGETNLIDDGESPVDDLLGYRLLYKILKKRLEQRSTERCVDADNPIDADREIERVWRRNVMRGGGALIYLR